jgi:hypothetical protein
LIMHNMINESECDAQAEDDHTFDDDAPCWGWADTNIISSFPPDAWWDPRYVIEHLQSLRLPMPKSGPK